MPSREVISTTTRYGTGAVATAFKLTGILGPDLHASVVSAVATAPVPYRVASPGECRLALN
jgi:hypothetical protein